jgi:hypothetical protein
VFSIDHSSRFRSDIGRLKHHNDNAALHDPDHRSNAEGEIMITKFSGVTDPHNIEERKSLPFHWHPNVYATGTIRQYLGLCDKIRGQIGMYVHPSTVTMDFDLFPPSRYPIQMVKDDWYLREGVKIVTWTGLPLIRYLDLRVDFVRDAIIQWIVLQAKLLNVCSICLDNISYNEPCGPVSAKYWTDTLRLFLRELRDSTQMDVVINIGASVSQYDSALRDFGQIVNGGVLLENPFHPNMDAGPDPGHVKELDLYKWYVSQRRKVYLMPPESRYDETCKLVDGIAGIYVSNVGRKD